MNEPDKQSTVPSVDDVVMRLYVWRAFCPDYTDGLAVAVASSIEEARSKIIEDMGFSPGDWGDVEIFALDDPIGFAVSGGG